MAAAEGGPPRCSHPRCPPGYPLGVEAALEGPALQYRYHVLPVGVEERRPAQEPVEGEGEGEGRSPAPGPRQRRTQSRWDDECQHIWMHGAGRVVLALVVDDLRRR